MPVASRHDVTRRGKALFYSLVLPSRACVCSASTTLSSSTLSQGSTHSWVDKPGRSRPASRFLALLLLQMILPCTPETSLAQGLAEETLSARELLKEETVSIANLGNRGNNRRLEAVVSLPVHAERQAYER